MKKMINLFQIVFLLLSTLSINQQALASQHDYSIANDTGANVRIDINGALQASQSQNSGTSAPATTYAFQLWMDTSGGTPILKIRNAANNAWISIGDASLTGLGLLDRSGGTVSGELILSATNDVKIPVGTTAQRNGTPVNGQIRYNSDLKNYEGYHESQFSQFQREVANSEYVSNLSIGATVSSNALTFSALTASGAVPSAGDPAIVAFRSATAASGDISLVKITGALTTVISSGSTAGHPDPNPAPIYVYLINNGGTAELAWASTLLDEAVLYSTTAEGGAGGADSFSTLYSTTARTNVPLRLIGKIIIGQATPGLWAALPSSIQTGTAAKLSSQKRKPTIQKFTSGTSTYITPVGIDFIIVEMVGGGGGGSGSGTASSSSNGSNGGNTTFGTSLLTANGGTGATWSANGVAGGTFTVNSPAIDISSVNGTYGGSPSYNAASGATMVGGSGGQSRFAGAGIGSIGGSGVSANANSGSGGGGGGGGPTNATYSGTGGSSGAYVKALITSPSGSYSYSVGTAGSGGSAGTNGYAGGNGAAGVIIVTEYYK